MKTLTVLSCLIALSFAGTTKAEVNLPPAKGMMVQGAMLCDTLEEVQMVLTGISLTGGKFLDPLPASCGRFMPEQPIPMVVTPVEFYETPMATTLIAQFYHAPSLWIQYGWVWYELNPDYVPPAKETDS